MEGLDKYLTNEPNTYERFDLRNSIHLGDCLEVMKKIPTGAIDLILCDLPYGTTETNWDNVLSFEKLWEHYKRIITPTGAILLFSSKNFTIDLINSNRQMFKYFIVWNKKVAGSFAMAEVRPMLIHEEICVFSKGNIMSGGKNNMNYFPKLKDANPDNVRPINNGSSTSEANFGQRKNIREAIEPLPKWVSKSFIPLVANPLMQKS